MQETKKRKKTSGRKTAEMPKLKKLKKIILQNPHPKCRIADRNRDIYAAYGKKKGKEIPANTKYDMNAADSFLSMNFLNFLQDFVPEEYLEDPQIAADCMQLCVLAWNLSVIKSKVSLRKYASSFKMKTVSSSGFKDILSAFGENLDEMLDCLIGIKKEEYKELHDFIWSWEMEKAVGHDCVCGCGDDLDEECCGEKHYMDVQLSIYGCSPAELKTEMFE